MIEVEQLTKYYSDFCAIENVSFKIDKGEIVGFLGPNGAGKTTTMRILTCYMPATSGTARIAGNDVFTDSMQVRRRIGYMPESPPLYNDMTVKSYLSFVAKIKGIPRKERKRKIEQVLERTATVDVAGKQIGQLSRGYRQRVGLAQALVHEPEVLILDEPTTGLDPNQTIEIRKLIKSLAAEHTIIFSTHILYEVMQTCSRAIIINRGRIIADDKLENLSSDGDLEKAYLRLTQADDIPVAETETSPQSQPPVEDHS
jgi:gliding motility-associated transport system ATP-binding protein